MLRITGIVQFGLFFLELLQCREIFILYITCIEYVIYARRVYIAILHQSRTINIHLQHRIVYIIVIYVFCTLLKHTNTNRLTPLYSEIYYKKKNYLKVRTVVFKYITPPIVKVKYIGILVYLVYYVFNISTFLYSELFVIYYLYNLAYPLSYSFTGFISPASYTLILT